MFRDVSIIIPTFNRSEVLGSVLFSYCIQDNVSEVIVVNDGSNTDYNDIVQKFMAKFPNINFILINNNKNLGQAACRNLGIKKASGTYILMGEDDVFLDKDYVSILRNKIIKGIAGNKKIAVCGNILYDIRNDIPISEQQTLINKQKNVNRPLFEETLGGNFWKELSSDVCVPFGHALIMVAKNAYNNEAYYEGYTHAHAFREETDGQIRLLKKGYKIYLTSDTQCYHLPKSDSRSSISLIKWYKINLFKIINNHKFLKRNHHILFEKGFIDKNRFMTNLIFDKCTIRDTVNLTRNYFKTNLKFYI